MYLLVIEKNMRTKGGKYIFLAYSSQEKRLIYTNIPVAKGFNRPLMGGRIPGCDQRGSNWCLLFSCKQ